MEHDLFMYYMYVCRNIQSWLACVTISGVPILSNCSLCREIAMEILSQQEEGSFLVRDSVSNPGCYALSLRGPRGSISHFLIERAEEGLRIQVCVCVRERGRGGGREGEGHDQADSLMIRVLVRPLPGLQSCVPLPPCPHPPPHALSGAAALHALPLHR